MPETIKRQDFLVLVLTVFTNRTRPLPPPTDPGDLRYQLVLDPKSCHWFVENVVLCLLPVEVDVSTLPRLNTNRDQGRATLPRPWMRWRCTHDLELSRTKCFDSSTDISWLQVRHNRLTVVLVNSGPAVPASDADATLMTSSSFRRVRSHASHGIP